MVSTFTTYKASQITAKSSPGQSSGEASSKSVVGTNTNFKARQVEYEERREKTYRDRLCLMCSDSIVS